MSAELQRQGSPSITVRERYAETLYRSIAALVDKGYTVINFCGIPVAESWTQKGVKPEEPKPAPRMSLLYTFGIGYFGEGVNDHMGMFDAPRSDGRLKEFFDEREAFILVDASMKEINTQFGKRPLCILTVEKVDGSPFVIQEETEEGATHEVEKKQAELTIISAGVSSQLSQQEDGDLPAAVFYYDKDIGGGQSTYVLERAK